MALRGKSGIAALLMAAAIGWTQGASDRAYIGFDRNDYPGDTNLTALRKSFQFTSYWLNNPPGAQRNTWAGKRTLLKQSGFGFMLLFNGRLYQELKGKDAAALGSVDGKAAVAAAQREGFLRDSLIFLDQEEGGRLLPEQEAYLFAWVDAVRASGGRAGIYCSGIEVPDGSGTISTARDIVAKEKARTASGKTAAPVKLWIANDQCPPSPGCTLNAPQMSKALAPDLRESTLTWQYAQSPRRAQFTGGCPANYAADNRCYAPGMSQTPDTFVDLNVSTSPDPSGSK